MTALHNLASVILAHPAWWIIFALVLAAITASSLAWFEKKWLRAWIAAGLALEGAWLLCSGYVG